MEQYFKDKTVLVTGAGWGVGAATASLYAAYGAKVIVSDTSRKGGNDTVAKIKSKKGNATYIKTDVNNAASCEKLIKRTIETYGSIDIACNNSAVFTEALHLADKDIEAFDSEAGLNLNGLYYCMRYELDAMQKQGGGIIVNMSSILGLGTIGLTPLDPNADAKCEMYNQMQDSPQVYSEKGIRIIAVAPAFVNTTLQEYYLMMQRFAGLVVWMSFGEAFLPTVLNDDN